MWIDHPARQDGPASILDWLRYRVGTWMQRKGADLEHVYKDDEVPVSWGILGFKEGKLREKRKPPKLEAKPITRAFVSQMFRRSHAKEERDISSRIAKALANDRAAMETRIEDEVKRRTRSLREDGEKFKRLCEQLGQPEWASSEEIIAAVKVVLKSSVVSTYGGMTELLRKMKSATADIEAAAAMFSQHENH